jgi:hypothetical protein
VKDSRRQRDVDDAKRKNHQRDEGRERSEPPMPDVHSYRPFGGR